MRFGFVVRQTNPTPGRREEEIGWASAHSRDLVPIGEVFAVQDEPAE
jgi:hypothetical protein